MNTMDDLYPGCANGRRLDVMRCTERNLLDHFYGKLDATSDNGGHYPGCLATDHNNYRLVRTQLDEMEFNLRETGFAVTNNELNDAIVLGAYSLPAKHVCDWKVHGF